MVDPFRSQWFITFNPASHLDKKHTVFGNLVGGDEVLATLEKLPVKAGTERPSKPVQITDVIMFVHLSSYPLPPPIEADSKFLDTKTLLKNTSNGKRNDGRGKLKQRRKPRQESRSGRKTRMP